MSPETILLAVAAVAFVLYSRLKGQPLTARRLLIMPVVLVAIGCSELGHPSSTGVGFLVAAGALSLALGAVRGATVAVFARDGALWYRYRKATLGLWLLTLGARGALVGVASALGLVGGYGMLVSLGLSLLGESAVVGLRAQATGIPFAPDGRRPLRHDGTMTTVADRNLRSGGSRRRTRGS